MQGPSNHLPRLPQAAYQGHAAVHWTLTTYDRDRLPLSLAFHAEFKLVLLHTLARGDLVCPIYCLMPDHLHMIWMGLSGRADQMKSIAFFNTHFAPLISPVKLQPQPYDHVLRQGEQRQDVFVNACGYVRQNPVRASLVDDPADWDYTGTLVSGYPKLNVHEEGYWLLFAKLLTRLRHERCSSHS